MSFESGPSNSGKESGMNEALAALAAIEAQVHSMGANDSETSRHGDLAQIRQKLLKGEIPSDVAIAQAESLRDSKQAYH